MTANEIPTGPRDASGDCSSTRDAPEFLQQVVVQRATARPIPVDEDENDSSSSEALNGSKLGI